MSEKKTFRRSGKDRIIGGVCGGIAKHFGWTENQLIGLRIGVGTLSFCTAGVLAILYLVVCLASEYYDGIEPEIKPSLKKFVRDLSNKKIAGVCSGIANYFNIDPFWIRFAWVASILLFGFGFGAYLVCMVVIPANE